MKSQRLTCMIQYVNNLPCESASSVDAESQFYPVKQTDLRYTLYSKKHLHHILGALKERPGMNKYIGFDPVDEAASVRSPQKWDGLISQILLMRT